MCLAIPLQLKSIDGDMAVGEVDGIQREISVMMTPAARVGDYVIVHAGFAIQVLDQQEAEENLDILRKMAEAVDEKRTTARKNRAGSKPD